MWFLRSMEMLEARRLLSHSQTVSVEGLADADVTVMTQNLYYGGAFDFLLGEREDGGLFPSFDIVRETNFPERAEAIAREVEQQQPLLIALQEAVIWRTGEAFDGDAASDVEYDFTEILLGALQDRGLSYEPVAVSTNADIEVPGVVDEELRDLRMTDQDVILARSDLPESEFRIVRSLNGNYRRNLGFDVPLAEDVELTRGWALVDARVDGQLFRVINTHLEVLNSQVQQRQAMELVEGVEKTRWPVIVAGDMNAGPVFRSGVYQSLLDGGLEDAWTASNPDEPGLTCCQDRDLRNEESDLEARVDLVLSRGFEALEAEVVGEEPGDRTESGLWPSDHAGVVAGLDLAQRRRVSSPFRSEGSPIGAEAAGVALAV